MKKFVILLLLTLLITPASAHAFSQEQKSIYDIDAIYFEHEKVEICDQPTGQTTSLVGNENAERVWNFLIGKGLQPHQAAGIMGNLQAESGFESAKLEGGRIDPSATPRDGQGFGLAQWTFTSRQQPLVDRARAANKPPTDLAVQLDYLWWELTEGPFRSIGDQLRAIAATPGSDNGLNAASDLILERFEIPDDIAGERPERRQNGKSILSQFGSTTPGPASAPGSPSADPGQSSACVNDSGN